MKKFILGLILLQFALSINAQKGMHAVGANVSYYMFNNKLADYWEDSSIEQDNKFGLGLKYQYYVTNYFRFSCSIKGFNIYMDVLDDNKGYIAEVYKIRGIDVSLDSHWFITRPSRLRPYGILGLSTGRIENTFDYDESHLGINYGAGIQYETNSRITLQMEIIGRYGFPRTSDYEDIERPFDNFQISIGAVYNIL